MKRLSWIVIASLAMACAHGKMGQIDQALDRSAVSKTTPIFVEPITTENTTFTGDKAGELTRIKEEKAAIRASYNRKIAEALRQKGYNARAVDAPVKSGVVVKGNVRLFEHGSAAARIMVGMGAGSSNMFTDVVIENRSSKKNLSKFEVIATSGGRGGLAAASSFMDAHLIDGAEKIAEYVAGETK